MERIIEKIPSWAISAIINNDRSGLLEDEIQQIEDWSAETGYDYVCCPQDEPYFSPYPAFGKVSDVYDCLCIKL